MTADNKSYGIKQKLMRGKLSVFIICIFISGFLWLSHRLNQTYYYSIKVPVKFINLPANKALINKLPESLRIDIKTSGLKLFFVLMNRPFNEITIDFNTLKSDNKFQAFALHYGSINLKSVTKLDVDIKNISPDTLFFANKVGISKNVAVKAVIYANPEKGFSLAKPNINPTFITITGDSTAVNGIDTVSTQPLYLTNIQSNYSGKLVLIRPSENVFLNINEVDVYIQADKLLEKELVLEVTVVNTPTGAGVKVFPGKVKIRYSAAKNDFNEINESSFKLIADYNKKSNQNKIPVEIAVKPTQAFIQITSPPEVECLLYKTK